MVASPSRVLLSVLLHRGFIGNSQGCLGARRFHEALSPTAHSHPRAQSHGRGPGPGLHLQDQSTVQSCHSPGVSDGLASGTFWKEKEQGWYLAVPGTGHQGVPSRPYSGCWQPLWSWGEKGVYKVRVTAGLRNRVPGRFTVIGQASVCFKSSSSSMCFSLNSTSACWEVLTLLSRWGWVFPVRSSRAGAEILWASDMSPCQPPGDLHSP